ncbi:MAG: sensor histidine kinase [Clostridia bacterium]|nr:sensor histidine kinase [Clostridia bacterium]
MLWRLIKRLKDSLDKMSLRTRLIFFTSSIIILSISISNYVVMMYSRNHVLELSRELIGNTMEQVSRNVSEAIISKVYTLSEILMQDEDTYKMLAGDFPTENDNSKEREIRAVLFAKKITNNYLSSFDGIRILALFGKNGQTVSISYSSDFSPEAKNEIDKMISECQKSNTIVHWYPLQKDIFSTTLKDTDLRSRFVVLASRALINPGTGEYIGTGIFIVPEKTIYNAYSGIKLGKSGEILISNLSGEIFSHSDKNKLTGLKIEKGIMGMVEDGKNDVMYFDEDGKRQMIFSKSLRNNDWVVIGKVPVNEISEKVSPLLFVTVLMMSIFILITIVFITIMVENIVRPIKKIIRAMKTAEKGNLDVRAEVKGQYEISEMAGYFNSMIAKIQKLIIDEYELEKKKKEAELNVLMGQINPHFLYNTLESIIWKAQLAGESEICDMAASLGNLYRISVNRGNLLVRVSEELEHVKAYLDIQKLRYKERIQCDIIVENDSVLKCYTLKMILQPIVENALTYGVEMTGTAGKINIAVKEEDGVLKFSVSDNGVGMLPEELEKLRQKIESPILPDPENAAEDRKSHKGIGLRNINERIKLYFGETYGLTIESVKDTGTVIYVNVPVIFDKDYKL